MWRWGLVIGLLSLSGSVSAQILSPSQSQGQAQGQGQDQGQEQDQAQAQAQGQGQSQGQVAVGGVAVQGQSSSQANAQSTDVSVIEQTPRERQVVRGSMAQAIPQGNEGLAVQTPWGGPMISQGSPMAKVAIYHGMVEGTDQESEAIQWARNEAQPRRLLGIQGSERGCRNWLINLLCF